MRKKLVKIYKWFLVSIYSTHFNENRYKDKFIGNTTGLISIYFLILQNLIVKLLKINIDIPTLRLQFFIITGIILAFNYYLFKNKFNKEEVIQVAIKYEEIYGGLGKKFNRLFYFSIFLFFLLAYINLYHW